MNKAEVLPRYLTRRQASAFLTERGYRLAPATLQALASRGGGPPYRRFGKLALYAQGDLEAWVLERLGKRS